VYDTSAEAVTVLAKEGATGAASLDDLLSRLSKPRVVWMMVPAAAVDRVIADVAPRIARGDVLVDGGNSFYVDDIRRAKELAAKGIHYVDVGTSGGLWGLEHGYCQMIGGEPDIVKRLDPVFRALAPSVESAPLQDPERYRFDFDLADIAEVWRRGSVIASWLLDLTAATLLDDPGLAKFAGRVSDSGEGRWTIHAAVDEAVPAPMLTAALYQRFTSRGEADFADKILSAMRFAFGGHLEKK
jgi:6-phosphogluconate dehydrogenase